MKNHGTDLQFEVVIAGGGFAGVYCAQGIARALGPEARNRVAIIADENYMVFQPMLAEVVGSSISPRHVVNPIRRICPGVTVLRGGIAAIDLENRSLSLDAGHFTGNVSVGFGHLVLALGGIVDLSRVPGMPEHAYLMKTVGDAQELRGVIIDRIEEANLQTDDAIIRRLLTFVIVGGGYSGVETAGQILDLIEGIKPLYPRIARPDYRVVLVHSGAHLLPEISESLGRFCEENIRARGVEVILNSRVVSMTASKATLGDGRVLATHTVVSTVGNAPHPLLLDLAKKHNLENEKGRLLTEPTMRVKGQSRLWAAGDCAAVPMADTGRKKNDARSGTADAPKAAASPFEQKRFCPPTAQFAYRQGLLLGKNIAADLRGGTPKPFTFTGLGELAAIGHHTAVADIFGWQFSGFFAWFLWRGIYLAKLPGLERKLRVMIDWTLDLFFPRDITLLRARPSEVTQEVHLETGDTVFHSGEPALSFYIVKKGRIDLLDANGVVKTLAPGEHFGERALLSDKIWRFNAVAAEPSTLVALDGKVFAAISRASSSIQHFFEHSANQYLTRQQVQSLVDSIPPAVRALRVEDVMSKTPVTLRADQTLAAALGIVAEHPYNSFPLLDPAGKTLGVISQNQIYDAIKNGEPAATGTLEKIAPLTLPTLLPQTPVSEALERFLRSGKHKLLVLDEAGKLCGILTPVDLLARRG